MIGEHRFARVVALTFRRMFIRLGYMAPRQCRADRELDLVKQGQTAPAPPPLEIRLAGKAPFRTADEHLEIIALVRSLLNDRLLNVGALDSNAVILEVLSGGRSGAYVFKATLSGGSDRRSIGAPMVVKISPLEDGERERANYDQFVRPFLATTSRPDLLGYAQAQGRAALCYSFVGDGDKPETLTARLVAGDLATLDFVLSTTFEQLRHSWCSSRLIEVETDLARYYLDRYFKDPSTATEAEDTLFAHASRHFDIQRSKRGYSMDAISFPSIYETLFSYPYNREYRSCILHGDLNTDNIIVDRDHNAAQLIDFLRTGRGHVYQDLVSLEASVRINYPSNAPFSEILEIERLVAVGGPVPPNSYATGICSIRATARHLFGHHEEASTYPFAVAAVGLRLMRATDLSEAARARISASALWAAKTLMEI